MKGSYSTVWTPHQSRARPFAGVFKKKLNIFQETGALLGQKNNKSAPMAPRTHLRYPHEGPSVVRTRSWRSTILKRIQSQIIILVGAIFFSVVKILDEIDYVVKNRRFLS
jgi:hypothetical protein